MSTTGPGQMGLSADSRPHAYDPLTNPELFDGVLARRVIAFVIDAVVISIPIILATIFTASPWGVRNPPPSGCA